MNIDKRYKEKLKVEFGPYSFAHFLRAARTSSGLTQEAFGKKIGLSRANVCDIEKGRYFVSAEVAVNIARKVGFSEKIALQACLQDQVRKAGSEALVKIS